jgi:GNAT superfamily N-acetyltransferase
VLDDGHRAVGYIAGTPDTAAFVRAYRARWIPRLAGRYPVPPEPAARPASLEPVSLEPVDLEAVDLEAVDLEEEMIALHYRPERMLWPGVARYPAHLHIDLLPPFQGAGHGRAMMEKFFAAAARAGASGVHVTVMAANVRAIGFYRHLRFRTAEVEVEGKGAVERNAVYLTRSL